MPLYMKSLESTLEMLNLKHEGQDLKGFAQLPVLDSGSFREYDQTLSWCTWWKVMSLALFLSCAVCHSVLGP